MNGGVSAWQRASRTSPCPICSGYPELPRGRGTRGWCWRSSDGAWQHCTRSEYAGPIPQGRDGAFAHRLRGACLCGREHARADRPMSESNQAQVCDDGARVLAAQRIWAAALAADRTHVETYLRGRGLTLAIPGTLRFARLPHAGTRLVLPAMVAGVAHWPSREVVGVHRTFLAMSGETKAPVTSAKMMLGRIAGGAVRLAPAGERLAVAEGIESALSVQQATGIPSWAALSASGLERLVLPPVAQDIVIAADRDEVGIASAERAARRWVLEGRRVRIALPPGGLNDFNDALRFEAVAP